MQAIKYEGQARSRWVQLQQIISLSLSLFFLETDKREGYVYTTQQPPCPAPIKEKELSEFPDIVCLKKMLPSLLVSFILGF